MVTLKDNKYLKKMCAFKRTFLVSDEENYVETSSFLFNNHFFGFWRDSHYRNLAGYF
ncbi:hypothetical protein LGAA44_10022 [Leuconostoc gasicomitatum]|nr:hypothetical protein LGAA44_10022 [Leuconostoc gasicomitatum]